MGSCMGSSVMKKVTIRDNSCRGHFTKLLNEWCNVIERYTEEYDQKDALYWYNERATLSTLSVAAGRSDFYVLEEYSTQKYDRSNNNKYKGRSDLFLGIGRSSYVFEAKQIWVSLSERAKDPKSKIKLSLRDARREVVVSNAHGTMSSYGIVFAVPFIRKSYWNDRSQYLDKFIGILKDLDYDAMAYVFPDNGKTITEDGTYYPGVVCVIRSPRRPPR